MGKRKKSNRILFIDTSTNLAIIEHGIENYTLEYLHEKRIVQTSTNPIMLYLLLENIQERDMEVRTNDELRK
ncbi:hypothetical protein [Turicibacter sanguinis]|jgi:hypothetical protein|uniref:hypothetical protein n=1 Tax=Turicibacter sanguinis TaxID=154288 RepID=UPI00325BDBF9